jgi:hypothetical protein
MRFKRRLKNKYEKKMELIIHAYGYSGLIVNVLNGLAMFRSSNFYPVIINTMVLMVGTFYAWRIAASGVGEQWRGYLTKCFGMIIFVNALLLPKTSMFVKDHVEKSFHKVDNIPLAFSLPIGVVENYGHILTHGFDQAFSFIGGKSSLSYYNFGTIFGARLAKEVLEAKIRDPEVAGNMREFVKRCVMLPAMIGHKFNKEQLVNSTDIWGLLKKAGGDLTRVDMTQGELRSAMSCAEAMNYFESKFNTQNQSLIANLTNKFRGAGGNVSVQNYKSSMQLNNDMNGAIKSIFSNNTTSVDSILKNNMIINSLNNYRSGKYATARAQMHQEAGGLLSGDLAEKTLTGSLALMKVLVYSSFIFLLPMLILAGGFQRYKSWIIMAFSLSLWPPLFTILNMVIDFAYEPAMVVSYSSWATEKKKFDSIASLAAGLTLSIPFLAYYMTRLGEGGFTQLAGTILASANAATGAIAGERSSGSRSWDNESIGNTSYDNSNAFKTNHNMEYASGENGWSNKDGSRIKMTAGGTEVITSGAGITSDVGETRYTMEDSNRAEASMGAQSSKEFLEAKSASYSNAKSNTFSQSRDWLKNIAKREAAGGVINYEAMGEQGKNVQRMVSTAKTLAKDYGYSWNQAIEGSLTGSISSGCKIAGNGVTIEADGKITVRNSSDQQFNEKEQIDRNNHIAANTSNIARAAKNQTHSNDNSVDKSLSSRVTSAYEEQQRLAQEVSKAHHQSEAWHEAQNLINSRGGSSSRDMIHELTDRYMKEYGINDRNKAHRDVSQRTPEVMRTWNKMLNEDNYVQNLVNDIAANKAKLSPESSDMEFNEFNKTHAIDRGAYDKEVDQAATNAGFKGEEIQQNVANTKNDLNAKFKDITTVNGDHYVNKSQGIKVETDGMQAKINKFEEDRMGQQDYADLNCDDMVKPYSTKGLTITHVEGGKNISNGQRVEKQLFGNKLK